MRTGIIILIAGLAVVLASCSAADMTSPDSACLTGARDKSAAESPRWVWGNWRMHIPEDHMSIELVPVRSADLHYNVKMLLEQGPCDNCIRGSKFVNNGDGTISVDIKIRHPYPGNDYYTGFDVRGIFHTTASYLFPEPGHTSYGFFIPTLETGDPQLLNPDGYTDAYTWESPSWAPIFKYQPGGDLGGTFEGEDWSWQPPKLPFINYHSSEVRRHFSSSAVVSRTYHIALPAGEWDFGYSVDACWAAPTNFPIFNIETDFPIWANTLYPYRIDAFMSGPLIGDNPSMLIARFYNHQPEILKFYDHIGIYIPQCLDEDHLYSANPVIVGDEYVEFTCDVANVLGAPPGIYPLLITGISTTPAGDSYLWGIEKNWFRNCNNSQVVWMEVEN